MDTPLAYPMKTDPCKPEYLLTSIRLVSSTKPTLLLGLMGWCKGRLREAEKYNAANDDPMKNKT
jgi:hypothetical protein